MEGGRGVGGRFQNQTGSRRCTLRKKSKTEARPNGLSTRCPHLWGLQLADPRHPSFLVESELRQAADGGLSACRPAIRFPVRHARPKLKLKPLSSGFYYPDILLKVEDESLFEHLLLFV